MDKNKIKSFAIWARRSLIESVSEKSNRIGITKNGIEEAVAVQGGFKLKNKEEIFPLSKKDRDALVNQVREKGFEQVMEEVAYTWFNRFMGLRYMEVNDYLPSGVRILSSEVEGKSEPDVLSKVSEIINELDLNGEEIYTLLDSGENEDREKAYRIILVKQCNELGKIIPQMFEKIRDYTELLLPDNLLEEGSVIRRMVEDIEEEDWLEEVEIIGWMYQYYISEKKDEVFAALKKNIKITKENIPAATQLFTPKWIVKYMVENSLGRLWLEGHPNEGLQKQWKYYLEEADQEPEVEEELKKIREEHAKLKPEDIKVLDPCMGSGHILVYAFDVLYEIYKTAGYSEREIPKMILQNNLYGLDIDDRAAQLASFALIMKARHYNRRLFREIEREHLELNLCAIQESNSISKEVINYFVGENEDLRKDFEYLVEVFTDAKEYGSILEVKEVNFESIKQRLREIENEDTLMFGDYRATLLEKLPMIIKQGEIMSVLYEVCVTNPPYMGLKKGINKKLLKLVDKKYSNSKYDMYSVFIERSRGYTKINSYFAMITQQSWMFLSSYEKLREKLITSNSLINMLHLGSRAFDDIGGEVVQSTSFVYLKNKFNNYKSPIINLSLYSDSDSKRKEFFNYDNINYNCIDKFIEISGKVFAYWMSDSTYNIFVNSKKLKEICDPRIGLQTGNNEKFVRLWFEIEGNKFSAINNNDCKWYPYNKGGYYRKWYGNNEYIVNWGSNGKDIKEDKMENLQRGIIEKKNSKCWNEEFYLKSSISWSKVSTSNFSVRYIPEGFIFDVAGCSIFNLGDYKKYILAYLNSTLNKCFISAMSPTMNFEVGLIKELPLVFPNENFNKNIGDLVEENILISKKEWDSFETSWDFKVHSLLKFLGKEKNYKIEAVFRVWETECEENFQKLKSNEEELNRIFIDIYGLQDELTPEVEDKDITIRKADRERDIKSFISYAVGCMFGRYSIDVDGLIYAGGEFDDKWNLENNKIRNVEKDENYNIISDSWVDATFLPDRDNIIPITEDEYFEDDIVSRFIEFVRIVYGNDTLEENLDFIADSIGRKSSETSRQAIRRYFIKDFYKDHLKVYQKRPIYWMFESGKNDGFKCLVYMHRYNEQTVAKVRTDYLHTLQRKYEAEINRLQLVVDSEEYTAKDRTVAKKKIDRISKQIEECREYDQVVAYLANEKISIDLDDGVKVNYAKFQNIKVINSNDLDDGVKINYAKFQNITVINSKEKEVKMNLLAKI